MRKVAAFIAGILIALGVGAVAVTTGGYPVRAAFQYIGVGRAPSSGITRITTDNGGNGDNEIVSGTTTAGDAYFRSLANGVTNWSFGTERSTGNWVLSNAVGMGTQKVKVSNAGNVTINNPTAGNALSVFGFANSYTAVISASSTSGQSFGLQVKGGTNSSDTAMIVSNQANTLDFFKVKGDGSIQGYGPVAATSIDMTPDSGSFTSTYTGFSSAVTCTSTWTRIGKLVTLALCNASGTSNASTFTMTGLPAAISPQTLSQAISMPSFSLTDSGTAQSTPVALLGALATTISFTKDTSNGSTWTASGAKSIGRNASSIPISYLLN